MINEMNCQKMCEFSGIEIYNIKTEKFKTGTINVFFVDILNKETVTMNALIPAVLRRGTRNHNTMQEISLILEDLYGSFFDCGVAKKGEAQIAQFYMDYLLDQYALSGERLFRKAFDLLFEIVFDPFTPNNEFEENYVKQEIENVKMIIEGRINDKTQYAIDRCFEEMCKNEPFGIYEYGSIEALEEIDHKRLFEYYDNSFRKKVADKNIYHWEVLPEDLDYMTNRLKTLKRENVLTLPKQKVQKEVLSVKSVVDKMPVNQGKLSMGFRTQVAPNDDDYYKLLVYNGILGGGVHSKLFANVREKESLAYYAFSRLEKYKGLMIIGSGIEISNWEKARAIILEQMEDIKNGEILDSEYESTLKAIESGLNVIVDSPMKMVDFIFSQTLSTSNDTLEDIINKTQKVSKEDVQKVATKIMLDTEYFLTSEE